MVSDDAEDRGEEVYCALATEYILMLCFLDASPPLSMGCCLFMFSNSIDHRLVLAYFEICGITASSFCSVCIFQEF